MARKPKVFTFTVPEFIMRKVLFDLVLYGQVRSLTPGQMVRLQNSLFWQMAAQMGES